LPLPPPPPAPLPCPLPAALPTYDPALPPARRARQRDDRLAARRERRPPDEVHLPAHARVHPRPDRVRHHLPRQVHLDRRIDRRQDRKSTRLNSSHVKTAYAVFCF